MHADLVRFTTSARIPTEEGTFQLSHYVDARDGKEHLALIMGTVQNQAGVLVRVHSECFTGDVLGSQRCDCGEQLHQAMRLIAQEGHGIILYLRQEGRGIGLEQKLRAYNLQDQGYDTVDANLMLGHQADEREYSAAAAMLKDLGVTSIRLMTNNPAKIDHLKGLGITIDERFPLSSTVTSDNAAYLATKIQRMRHLLALPIYTNGHSHQHELTPTEQQLTALDEQIAAHSAAQSQPFVTLSYAQTLDGTIGTPNAGTLRISGSESLYVTHQLRARHDAILVGIGTVLADDPQLTVRLVEGASPQPVIVDSHLRLPLNARIWSHPKAPWIATLDNTTPTAKMLAERGARIIEVPENAQNRVDLPALFAKLRAMGMQSVMVEGGATIITNLIKEQLAHYAIVTIAPRYLPGLRVTSPTSNAIASIQEASYTQAGTDIVLWGKLAWNEHSSDPVGSIASTIADLSTQPLSTSLVPRI